MAKSILLNEDWEEDTVFPEKLAKLARQAYASYAKGEEEFTDPDNNEKHEVELFDTFDWSSRSVVETPGVSIVHENLLWQCWSAGTTKRNQEYFKFRAYCVFINPIDKYKRQLDEPLQVASGQIFHNKSRRGDFYQMQMFDAQTTAELKLARNLIDSGVSVEKIIQASDILTRSDLENKFQKSDRRKSAVSLG